MKKKHVLMAVIALLLLVALLQLDRSNLHDSMRQIPLWIVGVLLALQVVTQLLINVQWHAIARLVNIPMTYGQMLYVNCQGAVVDAITPGVKFGGEVTRAVQISRVSHCPGEQAAALVALQKLFSLSAMFIILLFATGYLVGEVSWLSASVSQFLTYGLLTLFLLVFVAIFAVPQHMKAYILGKKVPRFTWVRKVRDFFVELLDQVESIRQSKKACVLLFLLSLFIWVLYPVKMHLLTVQFFPQAGMMHVFAITFAAYMVAMLPIFPGGLGGFEGTMVGLLVARGVVVNDAAVITVFFRFATFWFVVLFSLVYIALCQLFVRRVSK